MRKKKILVVGSFVMDLIVSTPRFPQKGETVLGCSFRSAPGGKGANQAAQAAKLGADVTMVGKVGNDVYGDSLINSISSLGVNVDHVVRSERHPSAIGNVQIELGKDGVNNRIIVVPGANMDISEDDVSFLSGCVSNYDMILLQLEIPMRINLLVANIAKQFGIPVMLNCAPYAEMPIELLKHITFLSPNESEASHLVGYELNSFCDIESALRQIRSMGVEHCIITLGERGAAFLDDNGCLRVVPAIKNLEIKDPTAAGDSFIGAFCTAIAYGAGIEEAASFANHAAALTCCEIGAMPSLPALSDVEKLILEKGSGCDMIRRIVIDGD